MRIFGVRTACNVGAVPDTQDVSGRERGLACPTPHYKACVFRANFYQIDPSPAGMGFLSIQPPFTRAVRRVAGPISRQRLLPVLGVAPEKRQPLYSYISSNFAQRNCSISHSSSSGGDSICASEVRCPRFCIYGLWAYASFSRIPFATLKNQSQKQSLRVVSIKFLERVTDC